MRMHIRVEDNSRKTVTIFSTLHQRHFENTTEDLWPIKHEDNIQKQFHHLETSLPNKASLGNDMIKNCPYTVPYNCDKEYKDETSYSPNKPERTSVIILRENLNQVWLIMLERKKNKVTHPY